MADDKKYERIILAGGCFWCTEAPYDELEGVESAVSGYTHGHVENPTYEQIGTGKTGHYEAVEVFYDPKINSIKKVLEVFWENIDPFDAGGQFVDRGPQYRTAIIYFNEEQRLAAEASKAEIEADHGKEVVTEILPFKNFYAADDYHQNFYRTNPAHYDRYKKGSGRERKLEKIWGSGK